VQLVTIENSKNHKRCAHQHGHLCDVVAGDITFCDFAVMVALFTAHRR